MKNIYLAATMILFISMSCKKSTGFVYTPGGSVTVTNVVVEGSTLYFGGNYYTRVNSNSFYTFPLAAGDDSMTLQDVSNAKIFYYNSLLTVANTDNFSLFLTGSSPSSIESIQIKESYHNYTDSICGVRFINLSPGSDPVNVHLQGQSDPEAAGLAYKAYTDFKTYPGKRANASYTFEFRKADGTLITSYSMVTPYFHNATLALYGTAGTSAVRVLRVVHP